MTLKEKAEEYVKNIISIAPKMYDGHKKIIMKESYINGYKDGYEQEKKEKWHDLRKNPNDLPKEGVEVLVLYSNTYRDGGYIVNKHTLNYELAQYINDEEDISEWYWVETGTDYDIQEVIAWCELPKFEG